MFEHILLALDEPGDPSILLPVIRTLGRRNGSRVTVMQSAPFLETVIEMPAELSPGAHVDDEESAAWSIHSMVAHLRAEGFSAEGFAEIGQSALIIAAAAERLNASMILLSLRHPSWLRSLLRIAPIPVLAVPVARGRRSPTILVPIEDERSLEAIPYAAAMARAFQGGLIFAAEDRESLLLEARQGAVREGVPTEATLLSDDLSATLLTLSAAMIVLRTTSDDLLSQLAEASRVPLLLVRRPLLLPEVPASEPARRSLTPAWRRRSVSPFEGFGEP
jgi:hypothetical protein